MHAGASYVESDSTKFALGINSDSFFFIGIEGDAASSRDNITIVGIAFLIL